jgi:hypothetical protein
MFRFSLLFSAVLLATCFAARSLSADAPATQSTTGTVTGIVVDAQGNPVADCIVVAQEAGEKMRQANDTTTDKDGKFTLKDLAEGSYNVIARTKDLKSKAVTTVDVFAGNDTDAGKLKLKSK